MLTKLGGGGGNRLDSKFGIRSTNNVICFVIVGDNPFARVTVIRLTLVSSFSDLNNQYNFRVNKIVATQKAQVEIMTYKVWWLVLTWRRTRVRSWRCTCTCPRVTWWHWVCWGHCDVCPAALSTDDPTRSGPPWALRLCHTPAPVLSLLLLRSLSGIFEPLGDLNTNTQ